MAFRRPARTLWALWRAERRTLGQGLVALALSTGAGFVAGLTLAHLTDRLDRLPGLLVLIPAAVGMRGTIFGAIGARLGTASAAGLFEPTLRRDGVLYRNVEVAVLAGSLTLPLMLGGGYALAVVTARFGLDPDDHSVPIITSVMDLAGVVTFLLAMSAPGAGVR